MEGISKEGAPRPFDAEPIRGEEQTNSKAHDKSELTHKPNDTLEEEKLAFVKGKL